VVEAALDRLIPPDDEGAPGARAAGAADYIDGLLGAFLVDPPRIWAGGPFSGRHGGEAGFEHFLPLGRMEEWAWRTRIDELQTRYREGLERLGADFAEAGPDAQDARLDADPAFKRLLYVHACEGTYGDPVYGGNRDLVGWRSIPFDGDSQPRGWTDDEVRGA
jgi:gluconate 2-dehydrogenase gamma chain